ncbi:hypothetical protein DENSPDRAFT_926060 [Dentipellis sp. KUC8613]|nr:hypothetical protein DENSPDRAFT_926060 [Dentipellis sp. KUC8613]
MNMKTESDTTPATSQTPSLPQTQTPQPQATQPQQPQQPQQQQPTTSYATAQWATSQIPIDPALQQHPQHPSTQYYQSYQHYPQASYGHYQPYIPPPPASQPHTPAPTQRATQSTIAATSTTNVAAANNQLDTADVATLNDALGSAGVDLRAEEERLQRSSDQHQTYRPYEDRSRKQPASPNFDARFLGPTMRKIGTRHRVTKVPEDSVNYVALALRARLSDLITGMIAASTHRTSTQFDREPSLYEDGTPMWSVSVRQDIAKQLAALEKGEREEEMRVRRERKELAAAQAAALATHAAGGTGTAGEEDAEGGPKKKKKKADGPGVTAKNMSEDVRKKMSNAVARQAAGLGTSKYAWMNAATSSAATPPPKPKPAGSPAPTTTTPAVGAGTGQSSWARPYVATNKAQTGTSSEDDKKQLVTLRDALFVVEREKGHGGGRGAARGWV